MPAMPRLLAVCCLLVHCPCSHSVENCKSLEVEPEETSSLVTHLAPRQFGTNVLKEDDLPSQIPRKLLFNYKINLLKAQQDSLDTNQKILMANVKRTVRVWKNMTGDAPEVEMWDDEDCFKAIDELKMKEGHELALDFRREEAGIIRGDICRLVQLYNTGGFYLDLDVAPLDALQKTLDPQATFVTVKEMDGDFFQAFLATTPKHPVIRKSLKKFKTWYEQYWALGQNQTAKEKLRYETGGGNIGTALLARSFNEWSSSTSQTPLLKGGHVSQIFQEWQIEWQDKGQRVVKRDQEHFSYDDYCDYGVVDTGTNTVVMISRVLDWRNGKICEASKLSKFPANGLANFLGLRLP